MSTNVYYLKLSYRWISNKNLVFLQSTLQNIHTISKSFLFWPHVYQNLPVKHKPSWLVIWLKSLVLENQSFLNLKESLLLSWKSYMLYRGSVMVWLLLWTERERWSILRVQLRQKFKFPFLIVWTKIFWRMRRGLKDMKIRNDIELEEIGFNSYGWLDFKKSLIFLKNISYIIMIYHVSCVFTKIVIDKKPQANTF